MHADLLKTAAIRLLVFDDRVEIINPGCIMGGHSIEEVMLGNSFARNPLMANFCAKTMPYRGLGSGIPRVLSEDSHVKFIDSKDLHFDAINDNLDDYKKHGFKCRKIFANLYIDDSCNDFAGEGDQIMIDFWRSLYNRIYNPISLNQWIDERLALI